MGDTTLPTFDLTTSEAISISDAIMIGSIIVLIIIVAFCFSIYLYFKFYWSDDIEDQSIVSWRRQLAHQRRKTRQGLDAMALQSLPVVVYDTKDFKEALECVVCLSEVSKGEEIRLLPKCNHGFHVNCIDMWFKSHITCPLCRNPVISTHISEVQDDNSSDSSDYYYSNDDNSDTDSDSDNDSGSDSTPRPMEVHIFPANVLFWGNETQFRSFEQAANVVDASSSSVNRPRHHQDMVIEIPLNYELCDGCLSLSSSPRLEEAKTPVVRRLGSLKRLLSLGKRVVAPSPKASSSRDVCQEV